MEVFLIAFYFIQCLLPVTSAVGKAQEGTCKFYAGPGYKVLKVKAGLSNLVKLPQTVSPLVSQSISQSVTTAWMY